MESTKESKAARPFLKWCGGKARLLPSILPRIPLVIDLFCEPFAGGAAVFFALVAECDQGKRSVARFQLSDQNPELVNALHEVRGNPGGVVEEVRRLGANDEQNYRRVRATEPSGLSTAERAARFLFLNKAGFNGLYRLNREGRFNVPWGKRPGATIVDEEALGRASEALKRAAIFRCSFERAVAEEDRRPGTFCYFDPPYLPGFGKPESFVGYTEGGFGEDRHALLALEAGWLADRGCGVLLSNVDSPYVRGLYRGFDFAAVSGPRSMAANGGREAAAEVLISRGPR